MSADSGGGSESSGGSASASDQALLRRGGIIAALATLLLVVGSALGLRFFASSEPTEEVRIADVSSERLLGSGSVVGFADAYDTHAWLGIPFARPPMGEHRWRAPAPPDAWADTLDALQPGSPCPQVGSMLGGESSDRADGYLGHEDCLALNVWAPRMEPESVAGGADRLPVMVWIHGGSNTIGHAAASMYDGARLAGTQGVVVVTTNYRLGPFGWFSHPALRRLAADREDASGNFGTLDQIAALEWVRDNIEEFGGDPGNVTVFGESAGGTNVLALLASPRAAGLFHRAIAQSGSTDTVSRGEAENEIDAAVAGHRGSSAEILVRLLESAGVVPDRDAARRYARELSDADVAEFLRGRPADEIIAAVRMPEPPKRIDVPRLIRDGFVLPAEDWLDLYRSGRFNAVPILLGSNRDEMKLFHSQRDEYVRKLFKVFYRIRDLESYERRSRYASDLWKVRAVDRPAAALADSGRAPVFAYRFDWDEEPHLLGTDLSRLLGAAHGFEIPFVFGNFDLGEPVFTRVIFNEQNLPARERLAERMMAYWAEFARTGRPGRGGGDDAPEWPVWSDADGSDMARMLVLDTEADGGIRVASTRMTRDHVIAAIDSEPSLDPTERCALFRDLFSDRPDWSIDEFRTIGRSGCADFPLD